MVSLRIFGDALDPAELTALFGVEASLSHRKGDVRSAREGKPKFHKTGRWSISAEVKKPEDVNAQIATLLEKLPGDLSTWQALAARFEIDLFCGLFMNAANEGLLLNVATLRALADRNIKLGLDIYGPVEDEAPTENPLNPSFQRTASGAR
jgi:hypothetical protein